MILSNESFKELLNAHYEWPTNYTFKFIVRVDQVSTVLNYFDNEEMQVDKKPSKQGNYISISITMVVSDADHVITVYEKLEQVQGIIKL